MPDYPSVPKWPADSPPLDTLETRLVRIEGMLEDVKGRLDALKDNMEERLWVLLKILQDGTL